MRGAGEETSETDQWWEMEQTQIKNKEVWVLVPTLPLMSCVTLGKSLHLSEPRCSCGLSPRF